MGIQNYIKGLLKHYYKEKFNRYTVIFGFSVGLASGVFVVSAILEHFLSFKTPDAFKWGIIIYFGLFFAFLIGCWIKETKDLFDNPDQLFGNSTEQEQIFTVLAGVLYSLERMLMLEKIIINSDGSFESNILIELKATTKHVNAIEIHANYLGPIPGKEIIIDPNAVKVTQMEYSP